MASKKNYYTVGQKERTARLMVDRSFDPRITDAEQAMNRAALECLRAQLTEEEWGLVYSMPEFWLPRVTQLKMADPGHSADHVNFPSGEPSWPVPATIMSKELNRENSGDLYDQYRELRKTWEALKAEKKGVEKQALAVLNSYRTVEAACEGWPEAEGVIQEVTGQRPITTLPALANLNAALDLPPEQDAA